MNLKSVEKTELFANPATHGNQRKRSRSFIQGCCEKLEKLAVQGSIPNNALYNFLKNHREKKR